MIASKDRSYYFGASDTKYIVGNWATKTFGKWWLQKIGINKIEFSNEYTKAGNDYEHKIIDALGIPGIEKDKQIILENLRLRVNLDANTKERIHEVKTYNLQKGFDLKRHKDYVQQVQVQMFASNIHKAEIDAYGLIDKDYKNYFNEVDITRLDVFEIEYDKEFINKEYLPKLSYLAECLKQGKFPNKKEYEEEMCYV